MKMLNEWIKHRNRANNILISKDQLLYSNRSKCHLIKNILCNFQVIFFIGTTLALQFIYQELKGTGYLPEQFTQEHGNVLFYGKQNLQVHYGDFAKSAIHQLVLKPRKLANIEVCNGSSFELHKETGMGIRHINLFQTLGDTNIHGVSAYLDDRLGNANKFIRILAAGLYPGPSNKIFCNYECNGGFCSSQMYGIVLPAGDASNYDEDDERMSLKDVLYLACPLSHEDKPKTVALTTHQCGFSHNSLNLFPFNTQSGVVTPPRDIGICVRPVTFSTLSNEESKEEYFALWLEYLRQIGADQVFLYMAQTRNSTVIKLFEKEDFKILTTKSWDVMSRELETVVSEEAALNHCLQENMMAYNYILSLSLGEIPVFGNYPQNLKQLVRTTEFQNRMNTFAGYRIQSYNNELRNSLLVKSKMLLATAANHFIPLTGRPSFRILHKDYISIGLLHRKMEDEQIQKYISLLKPLVNKKIHVSS